MLRMAALFQRKEERPVEAAPSISAVRRGSAAAAAVATALLALALLVLAVAALAAAAATRRGLGRAAAAAGTIDMTQFVSGKIAHFMPSS
jgi:hypothetical protein